MSIRYKIITIILLLFNSICLSQTQIEIPWGPLAKSPWPMTHKDPQSTGRSTSTGPQTAATIMKKDFTLGIFSGPVIGENNRLYFGSFNQFTNPQNDKFHCTDLAGNVIWQHVIDSAVAFPSSLLAGFNNTIYTCRSDGTLYCFAADGTVKWTYKAGSKFSVVANLLNINLDSTLYFCSTDNYLYAIRPNGTLLWKTTLDNGFVNTSPTISPDGKTLYITQSNTGVYALNTDGSLKWKHPALSTGSTPPLVDNAGNIYFYNWQSPSLQLISLTPQGNQRWIFTAPDTTGGSDEVGTPTIDRNGNLSFSALQSLNGSSKQAVLYSVDYQGKLRWKLAFTEETIGSITQALICDSLGTIYGGSSYGINYYAISSEGKLLWKIPLNGYQVDYTGAIGGDGTLYVGVHLSKGTYPQSGTLLCISDKVSTITEQPMKETAGYALEQNYPNPFNPGTTIQYIIRKNGHVRLLLYDVLGNEVSRLVDAEQQAGNHRVDFSGDGLPSGVYFYQLETDNFKTIKKMVLIK